MHPCDRNVAGLTCSDVMADLSLYLDHDLSAGRALQIEAHVSECQQCASFGAAFAGLISQVRERLREPDPVPADVESRLRARLLVRT